MKIIFLQLALLFDSFVFSQTTEVASGSLINLFQQQYVVNIAGLIQKSPL